MRTVDDLDKMVDDYLRSGIDVMQLGMGYHDSPVVVNHPTRGSLVTRRWSPTSTTLGLRVSVVGDRKLNVSRMEEQLEDAGCVVSSKPHIRTDVVVDLGGTSESRTNVLAWCYDHGVPVESGASFMTSLNENDPE